jgi:hypothetical protein
MGVKHNICLNTACSFVQTAYVILTSRHFKITYQRTFASTFNVYLILQNGLL